MKLYSRFLSTDVTCVVFYEKHVIAGMGSSISIFEVFTPRLRMKVDIFHGQKVHGICPGPDKHIAVFGGRCITIIKLHLQTEVQLSTMSSWNLDDWILCLRWLEGGDDTFAVATAHNVVSLWNWKTRERLKIVFCQEKCILYSALLVGDSWGQLTLLAGTVFREVVVWAPTPQDGVHNPVLHRLRGHQGVIFSISYNPRTGHIHTTSDDRSVRVWKVEPARPESWVQARVELVHTLFGHAARVWRSVELDDIAISIGEDSQLCMWGSNGRLMRRWATHQGGTVWSIACDPDTNLIVTGGGDGGVSLWPLDSWKDMSLRPAPLNFSEELTGSVPHRVVLLADGHVASVTDAGALLHCTVQDTGQAVWGLVHCNAKLANYCLLEVSRCRRYLALATLDGHILIFRVPEETSHCQPPLASLVDTPAVEGRVFSLQWLSTKLLLTCGALGKLEMWALTRAQGGPYRLDRIQEFLLPLCKERWLTSALVVDTFLLCGDRAGSIHLYTLTTSQEVQSPCETLLRLHGRMGVSSLAAYADCLYSTGRDGMLRQYRLLREEQKLQPVCADRLPMEWVASTSDSPRGLVIVGFSQYNFVLWSQREQRVLAELPCGGGHRSWDCAVSPLGFSFIYIRDRMLHLSTCRFQQLVKPILQTGFHIREVNCVRLWRRPGSPSPLFVSAGDDTTVRITDALHKVGLQVLSVQRSHISSVRALALCRLDETTTLLFSAGGRAQMKAWQLTGSQEVVCQELTTHMLKPSNYRQRKPWRLMEPQVHSETRYMSLCAIRCAGSEVLVIAGCSDGVLRLFCYDSGCQELRLTGSYVYHNCCILVVAYLAPAHVALSMATDGNVAFWDVGSMTVPECENIKPFFVSQLHKSGINSHDSVKVDPDLVLLATGGDDNAMALTLFRVTAGPERTADILLRWRLDTAHSTQVTGLAFMGRYLVSTAIDQRVMVWRWQCEPSRGELRAILAAEFCSTVADIQGLQAWSTGSCLSVCVYGRGMEIVAADMSKSELEEAQAASGLWGCATSSSLSTVMKCI